MAGRQRRRGLTVSTLGFAMLLGIASGVVWIESSRSADTGSDPLAPALVEAVGKQMHHEACGSCHVAYAPYFLPADSWHAMADALPEHFGVRLRLDETERRVIVAWLLAKAADVGGSVIGAEVMARLAASDQPGRVTATRWFRHRHLMISRSTWALPVVATPANCPACHRDAHQGIFDERSVHIPG